jgi:mRNA-degrading endonuclease RelE of RelBE toxin-antitoxin system
MMPAFREVRRLPPFERDLKRLRKRVRTLEEDLAMLIRAQISLFHKLEIENKGIFRIPGLPFGEPEIYKVKKFACRALKGRGAESGLRLVYAYFRSEDVVELVEVYFKGDKENEDRSRILEAYGRRKRDEGER